MSRSERAVTGLGGALLFSCVVVAVYAPQLGHAFQYDDEWKVVRNLRLRNPAFFAEDFALGSYSEAVTRLLPNLSLSLNYAWFGLQPFGYHATNLFFHVCNVLLVFVFARMLAARLGGTSSHFAWLAAALFGVHPLNSEAVYYCNARPNLMLTTFYLASLCLLVAAAEARDAKPARRRSLWLACVLCTVAALLCKEISITLLAVAPLLVWFLSFAQPEPYARWVKRGTSILPGVFAVSVLLLFFTSALAEVQRILTQRSAAELAITFADQSAIVFRYLGLFVLPWPGFLMIDHGALGHAYQRFVSSGSAAGLLWPALATALLLSGLLLALRRRRKAPLPVFAIVFAALAHLPLWAMPRGEAMVEYRTYLPMVGLCMLLAYTLDLGTAWVGAKLDENAGALRTLGYAVLLALLCTFTVMRGRAWATQESLWRDVLEKAPNTPRAYLTLGELARGRGDLDEAIRLVGKSLELNPIQARGLASLGGLLAMRGDLDGAKDALQRALAIDAQDAQAALNLGNVLSSLGDAEGAKRYYREALAIQPLFPEAELNLAQIMRKLGDPQGALPHYRRALELAPHLPFVYLMFGRALLEQGDANAAIAMWQRGLRVDDRQPAMHAQLAAALIRAGKRDEGLSHLRIAQQLAPNNPDVVQAAREVGVP